MPKYSTPKHRDMDEYRRKLYEQNTNAIMSDDYKSEKSIGEEIERMNRLIEKEKRKG